MPTPSLGACLSCVAHGLRHAGCVCGSVCGALGKTLHAARAEPPRQTSRSSSRPRPRAPSAMSERASRKSAPEPARGRRRVNAHFGTVDTLGLRKDATAKKLLARAVADVEPVMRRRTWYIREIREFYPDEHDLLGQYKKSEKLILVRLRTARDKMTFRDYPSVLNTVLHELTHIEHHSHDSKFYELLRELTREVSSARAPSDVVYTTSASSFSSRLTLTDDATTDEYIDSDDGSSAYSSAASSATSSAIRRTPRSPTLQHRAYAAPATAPWPNHAQQSRSATTDPRWRQASPTPERRHSDGVARAFYASRSQRQRFKPAEPTESPPPQAPPQHAFHRTHNVRRPAVDLTATRLWYEPYLRPEEYSTPGGPLAALDAREPPVRVPIQREPSAAARPATWNLHGDRRERQKYTTPGRNAFTQHDPRSTYVQQEPRSMHGSRDQPPHAHAERNRYAHLDPSPFAPQMQSPHIQHSQPLHAQQSRSPYTPQSHSPHASHPHSPHLQRPHPLNAQQQFSAQVQHTTSPYASQSFSPYAQQPQPQPQPQYLHRPRSPHLQRPQSPYSQRPQSPYSQRPQSHYPQRPQSPYAQQSQSHYPQRPQSPYAQQSQSPYAQQSQSPYAQQSQSHYPQRTQSHYPQRSQSPFPQRPQSPYPQRPQSPYPQRPQSPYPQRPHSPYTSANANATSQGQSIYTSSRASRVHESTSGLDRQPWTDPQHTWHEPPKPVPVRNAPRRNSYVTFADSPNPFDDDEGIPTRSPGLSYQRQDDVQPNIYDRYPRRSYSDFVDRSFYRGRHDVGEADRSPQYAAADPAPRTQFGESVYPRYERALHARCTRPNCACGLNALERHF